MPRDCGSDSRKDAGGLAHLEWLIPICRAGTAIREPHCHGILRTPWFSIIYVDITGSLITEHSQHTKIALLLTYINERASIHERIQGFRNASDCNAAILRMVGNHRSRTIIMYCMYVRAFISSGPITEYIPIQPPEILRAVSTCKEEHLERAISHKRTESNK